ncbi:MAG: hypothetical protein ACO1O6_09045 [Bacteroidota bacterium]
MCTTIKAERTCIICEHKLIGRSDKVFCDIRCKNKYHAEIRKTKNRIAKDSFEILSSNWYILTGLMQENKDKLLLDKTILDKMGFRFNYVSEVKNKGHNVHYRLFNISYRPVKHNLVYIEKIKSAGNLISPYLFKRWERKIALKNLENNLASSP